MRVSLTRRNFVGFGGVMLGAATVPSIVRGEGLSDKIMGTLGQVQQRLAARIGAIILDTQSGMRWEHRPGERFPMCSTFKAIAAGAVLARVDEGAENISRKIRFETTDVVTYSPVTKDRAGGDGMTLAELCEAAITQSDNTAGNMILKTIGGPSGFSEFARSLGDTVTRLDRWETELNEAKPGDPRDTTTPEAMADNLQTLALGNKLSERSRDQLVSWLASNKTGDAKLRAGLPKDWRVGDKTGGGDFGTTNDIAVIWPPNRKPLIVTVYMTETKASFEDRNAGIADIARALTEQLA
jgi:beta-lactamase class A